MKEWCRKHYVIAGFAAGVSGCLATMLVVYGVYTLYVDHQMVRALYQLELTRSYQAAPTK